MRLVFVLKAILRGVCSAVRVAAVAVVAPRVVVATKASLLGGYLVFGWSRCEC